MKTTVQYKNIEIVRNQDLKTLEVNVTDDHYKHADAYIEYITLVAEYAEIEKPDYVLFNKRHLELELSRATLNFTKSIIFNQMKVNGVKKILMVVSDSQYDSMYHDIENRYHYMKGFTSMNDAYKWIKEQCVAAAE